jgi:hypothetical protein
MRTYSELLDILGEGEIADVSATFWLHYHESKPNTSNYLTETNFAALLAFQNGWLACKEAYKIND